MEDMRHSPADRMLMIGPLPPKRFSASNPIGGAAVNFLEMVTQLTTARHGIGPRRYVTSSRECVSLAAVV